MATATPTNAAAGFQVQNGVKTAVDSSGAAVADQNAGLASLYGTANPAQSGYTPPTAAKSSSGGIASPYAVVTSGPATANYNGIQSDYQNTIAPNAVNAANNTAQQAAQASQIPAVAGYTPATTTKTGQAGEISLQSNGQTYYASPEAKAPTASDVASILSGGSTGTTGTPTPTGSTAPATPAQTAQAQTGINPTTENANYAAQTGAQNDQMTTAYNNFQNTINSIMSGAFPLSAPQQALVDATNNAFQQMTTQANLKAAALSSETGGVSNKITEATGELTNITAQQAAAVAKLEIGFQDQDYKMVTDSYTAYKDLETQKMDTLTKVHDSVMATYNSAVQQAQAQQTFNQTVVHDAAELAQSQYEFRDLKDATGTTIGTQVFDKATGKVVSETGNGAQGSNSVVPAVVTGSDGQPDPQSQAAYLATIPQPYQALVQGIANGKIEPPSSRTAKGAQILSYVAQYDPTLSDGSGGFDATKYAARLTMQKSLANYTAGSYGSALISANKVISHLSSFLNSSASLPGGAVNPFNINRTVADITGGIGALVGQTGIQSSQAEADQEARGLTDEMTKFFKGTGGTDVASLESWGSSLNPNASGGTQHGVVQGTLNLFTGQLNSFINQYTSVMGHAPDLGTIIQPQTMQTLSAFKNVGYNIDIPGVYYTDKNAYLSNGGSQESLTSAYSALQAKGIPTTPENILQAAQIINP